MKNDGSFLALNTSPNFLDFFLGLLSTYDTWELSIYEFLKLVWGITMDYKLFYNKFYNLKSF